MQRNPLWAGALAWAMGIPVILGLGIYALVQLG